MNAEPISLIAQQQAEIERLRSCLRQAISRVAELRAELDAIQRGDRPKVKVMVKRASA